jgi:hypothetical protein
MTLPLGSDPFGSLMSSLGVTNGDFNPDNWLSSGLPVDQPATPPVPPEGGNTKNEPHTVAAPPGAAASGGAIGVALDKAMTYLGTLYDWGGNGSDGRGVDCSGLLYAAFKAAGFNIQRYRAVDYGHMGVQVDVNDARPGDIVYFDNPGTDVDHVGIYLGNGKYIQAPHSGARVQISNYNGGGQIRRIFPEGDFKSLAVAPDGTAKFHAANGQIFTTTSKIQDPVQAIMSQLGSSSDPNALIQGLSAKSQLDQLLNAPFQSLPGAGSGNPVPPTRDSHDFTPVEAAHGGYTVGQVHGLSEAEAYIIQHESGGRPTADNPTSSAFGIWQGLASTRAYYAHKLGFDNPDTTDVNQQLQMFRAYISDRYGSAENAEDFWRTHHWY